MRAVVNALRIMRTVRSGVPVAPSNDRELLLDMPNIREYWMLIDLENAQPATLERIHRDLDTTCKLLPQRTPACIMLWKLPTLPKRH